MKDADKTKKQLIEELTSLRQEIAELQAKGLQQEPATEALRPSEKKSQELADLLPQSVFECDREGNLTFVNRNSFSLFGYSQEDFARGFNVLQAMVPEDRESAKENILRVLKGEKMGASEYTFLTKEGRRFPVIVYSSPVIMENEPVGLRGIVIDITDRKEAEEALRESERRYRILADHVVDMIFTMDMDLRFTHISPSAMRLAGYTPEEIVEREVGQLLSPNSLRLAQRTFQEEMAMEASGKEDPSRERALELELLRKDGSSVWVEVKMSFLRDSDGRPVEILGVARDITERGQAQQALQESEQRLRALFDRAAVGMALVDMEGRVLAANEAGCRILGYSPEEMVGMHSSEFTHPEDREKDLPLYQSLLRGERESYMIDKRYVRKHGEVVWGRLSVSLIRNQDGQPHYTVVVCEDITDRRRSEEAIRESEARYRAVMEQSPDGIYLIDAETREIVEANSSFQRMLGYTYQEVLGLSFYDFVVADREDLDRRFTDLLMGKGPFVFERTLRRKDGSLLDVWVSTKVISFAARKMILVVIRDLTEFRQTQLALQESEARYRAVMEQSPDGIYLVEVESKRLLQTNPAFQKMLGYSPEEMQGLTPYEFTAADRENINHRFLSVTTSKAPLVYERQFRRKDSSLLDAWVNANVISYGGKEVACFIVRDLTERKQAEERALRQSARLDGINKVLQETLRCETDEEVAKVCLNVAQELTGSKLGFIGEVNRSGRFDTIVLSDLSWATCRVPSSDSTAIIKDMEIRGIWGKVLKEGQSLIANDPSSHPDRVGIPPGHSPLTSFLGVPLKHAGRTIGMIALANKESGYDLGDQQDIETLSVSFVEALRRKRAEEAVRESEERYRTIMEQSPDGIFLVDAESRRVMESNRAFQQLLGYTAEEMRNLTLYDLIAAPPEDIDARFQEARKKKYPLTLERRYRRKEGSLCDVWVSAQFISYYGKEAMCVLIRDITERRQAEQEREKLIDELQEALANIKTLRGLIPICAQCKKIRDDQGYWQQVEVYVRDHSEASFSHGLCPECTKQLFPDLKKKREGGNPA